MFETTFHVTHGLWWLAEGVTTSMYYGNVLLPLHVPAAAYRHWQDHAKHIQEQQSTHTLRDSLAGGTTSRPGCGSTSWKLHEHWWYQI
jgi:hypothetical protein